MLSDILAQYDSVTEKLAALKAEEKEKTITYRRLFTNKLQYQAILSCYRTYSLLDNDKKCDTELKQKSAKTINKFGVTFSGK